MASQLLTITNSIAALTVSGLSIKDLDEIPVRVFGRDAPILYPEPLDFVTNLDVQKTTFGRGLYVKWNLHYTLAYTLLYAPVGSGRGFELFSPTVDMAMLIHHTIMESHPITGAELVVPAGIGVPGILYDVSGPDATNAEAFYGVRLQFGITEHNG
jgi:hypothetical protein